MSGIAPSVDGSLEGVVAASTAIAYVDGKRGVALVRGYPLAMLAAKRTYEDVALLVLGGELPGATERGRLTAIAATGASLTPEDDTLARALAHGRPHADALTAALVLADDALARATEDLALRAERVLVRVPSVCAAVSGVPVPPVAWTYAQRALAALGATRLDTPAVRAFEVLLALESEHGLSASTFACRVAASSGANAGVSLAAAMATLSGPRHGGATAEALTLLEEARTSGDVAGFVRERHARKARLAGFGHRIYKVPDPRLPALRDAMRGLDGIPLFSVAEQLTAAAEPLYGAKGVHANIDLYGAALLDGLGVPRERFVAAFALGVACGWLAHWIEQRRTGRLVRPESTYSGPPERSVP